MQIQVVTEPDVDAATDEQICRLQQRAFPTIESFRHGRHWIHVARPGDIRILACDGDNCLAQIAVYWANTPGGVIACVGNVCSDPDHRGQGYASVCIRRAVDLAADHGADWLMLCCSEPVEGFYSKLGFQRVDHDVWYTRPDGTTYAHPNDTLCMVTTLTERPWPKGKMLLDTERI